MLDRITRFKPHTLSDKEESLLAMQGEMAQSAGKIFRQLNDADLKFGFVTNDHGESVELTNSTFTPVNDFARPRRAAHCVSSVLRTIPCVTRIRWLPRLAGSIHTDVYYSKARGYESALAAALFPDNVPQAVYDNLISTVRRNLPAVHRYFEVRRQKMKLPDLHHYDTYVPILADMEQTRSWDDAVRTVIESLPPLGEEYCETLRQGLPSGWCDRYPNQGKQSGAFSCGSLQRQSVYSDELQADGAQRFLHADARSWALDAQSLLGRHSSRSSITTTRSSSPKSPARSTSNC